MARSIGEAANVWRGRPARRRWLGGIDVLLLRAADRWTLPTASSGSMTQPITTKGRNPNSAKNRRWRNPFAASLRLTKIASVTARTPEVHSIVT